MNKAIVLQRIITVFLIILFASCNKTPKKHELIIFHAGSLSVPFKQIAQEFEKTHPNTHIILEAAGSRTCARKISDLNRPCDIMASADYKVIDNLLIPDYAKWNLPFATNEMVIAFTDQSKYAQNINQQNWINILLKPDVNYGRSDPNTDPCGYRSILTTKLSALYYQRPFLADSLLIKDNQHIRPKEVDLLALLETQTIDYVFIYKSIALQHNLNYLLLPDSLNLGNPDMSEFYKQAFVKITGKTPTDSIIMYGEPMIYGLTQPLNSPNPELAEIFLNFVFIEKKGLNIIEQNGQKTLTNSTNPYYTALPKSMQEIAMPVLE